MLDPFIRKLEHGADLTEADHSRIASIARVRQVGAGQTIIEQGERPDDVRLVLSGFAYRYKVLRDGKRQIVALLVPGDFCDLHVAILGAMDHGIAAMSLCTIADLSRATVLDLTEKYPRIGRALWWATLVDEAVLREWLVNIGRREAAPRMAHLFCELLVRLQAVGLADQASYPFPLTQVDLADALGLTPVHVNRTVQALRQAGLIVLKKRRLAIPDVRRLKAFCEFDPIYLHLVKRSG